MVVEAPAPGVSHRQLGVRHRPAFGPRALAEQNEVRHLRLSGVAMPEVRRVQSDGEVRQRRRQRHRVGAGVREPGFGADRPIVKPDQAIEARSSHAATVQVDDDAPTGAAAVRAPGLGGPHVEDGAARRPNHGITVSNTDAETNTRSSSPNHPLLTYNSIPTSARPHRCSHQPKLDGSPRRLAHDLSLNCSCLRPLPAAPP